ncbi:uncharacterized protein LOC113874490 [Abrus precatorius]|uniref:Uncharacterized protein LOC113874490 n=1 Tax=Abrus precatorius TaxID=3816 RepID=A0A8B8MIF8_ABRPR|nr:uncharacterized protein LOC113874490 [Abrus precatorius]
MSSTPPDSPKNSNNEGPKKENRGNEATDPTMKPSSPFFIHPSEGPSSISITPILDGTNYQSWSRAIKMALISKNKIAFLLGTIPVPEVEEPLYSAWERCDLLILAELQEEIYGLSQRTRPVSKFYTALNTLWEELDNYRLFSSCSCPAKTYHQQDFIIRFLKCLDERFSIVHSQILLMDPLPAINRTFSMVAQQERQLALSSPTEPNAFMNATNHSFSGKGRGFGPSSAVKGVSNKKCSYCHRPRHTIDVCWGKHDYPPGHPRYLGRPKFNRDASGSSSINHAVVIEPIEGGNGSEKEEGPITLTQTQYQTLMSLLQPQQQKNASDDKRTLGMIGLANLQQGLYHLQVNKEAKILSPKKPSINESATNVVSNSNLWHYRL